MPILFDRSVWITARPSRNNTAIARMKEGNVNLRFRKEDRIVIPPSIHNYYLAKNIKALPADGDTMGTNERLRASFTSYSDAIRDIVLLLRASNANEAESSLIFEQAAQSHLNAILFRDFFQQLAPGLITPSIFQKIEDLNSPPREICGILDRARGQLATFQWKAGEISLEDFALVVAICPTQNSMGAYFTTPLLASQICRETIANWIIPLVPDALRKQLPIEIQETFARQNYITGSDVDVFFTQLPICYQKGLESHDVSGNLIKTLSLQISKCCILDPACGSGIFLAEAAKIIFGFARQLNSMIAGGHPDSILAHEICANNLHGVDLMPEFVRVARNHVFFTLLPHLTQEDVLPTYTALCQHIQVGNFLLSPFSEKFKNRVPAVLDTKILKEIATCFLDVITNYPEKKSKDLTALEKYARGPIEVIPNTAWEDIATHLGIQASMINIDNLSATILDHLIPHLITEKRYDLILGNPPQEGARKETGRQQVTSWTTRIQRLCIRYLQKMKLYSDLQGAWDFSLPFACRAMDLLTPGGTFAFILPRSVGMQSFARRFLSRIINQIRRVVYFSLQPEAIFESWDPTRQILSPAGNDFLVISCSNSPIDVSHYKVEELSPFNYLGSPSLSEIRQGEDATRFLAQPPNMPKLQGIPLKLFVTITKGATLCAKAEWRRTRGSFKTRDLVSIARDSNHPLRFVEPSHIGPFFIAGESFLEFHHVQYPDRVPANIHRWREDSFFHGPVLVTPLSKRVPSFALIPKYFENDTWRSPETVVLFKRWVDWFREFPENLPLAIERMKAETITALEQSGIPSSMIAMVNGTKILENLSCKIPLEVLALVLSSPLVHELRLRGGKSFGKFEAGDWENIPLPFLDKKEIETLIDHYQGITKILATLSKAASRSGTLPNRITKILEKVLFKDLGALPIVSRDVTDLPVFMVARRLIEQSFRLIADAYARTSGNLKEIGSFLKSRMES